ncbi:glycosyltransferase family 2 protein [Rossellomorea sp. DA94]|uniref:glycosyltransferase family 2 protein n=1 Tax=Rossellomorea sp. DA94 TaxID=3038653 RepID=UPI002446A840|nr:glycosyltransferase family 2 protein [Rossellomorea sp. DA94]WGG45866.1 glycosyltransferase family 2 protein [Rossellomorea sp. DA94]
MHHSIVSVVVPIYKVEKYIHRCIKSILHQTYPYLEIILVNDGSPDRCGEIAEEYKHKDSRIIVVHKENGGLSDARNEGMKEARGEYTVFVDSDDYLEPTMIEDMLHCRHEHQADLVQSAFYYAYDDKLLFDRNNYSNDGSKLLLDNQEAMYELIINDKVKNFAWGKLYRTELIKDIPFEKGVLFEDVFWAHQVMKRVKTFVLLHKPLCHYYQRSDSIVATYSIRNLDILTGLKERLEFVKKHYPHYQDEVYRSILQNSLMHYNLLFRNRRIDKDGVKKREIQRYIKEHRSQMNKAVALVEDLRCQLFFFSFHPLANISYLLLKKGMERIKSQPKKRELEMTKTTKGASL